MAPKQISSSTTAAVSSPLPAVVESVEDLVIVTLGEAFADIYPKLAEVLRRMASDTSMPADHKDRMVAHLVDKSAATRPAISCGIEGYWRSIRAQGAA